MYQCTSCGGRLTFDIASQHLKCEYCSVSYDPYQVTDGPAASQSEYYDVTIFSCPQCGGEIYSTDETAAGFCSFCGASTFLESRMEKEKRPVGIIPFKKTKEDCKAAYSKLMRTAIFAPKELKDEQYIDGFRGIYMPYWSYRFNHIGQVVLNAHKSYRRGDYIIKDHYDIGGEINANYEGLAHDASSSFADSISEQIAPYNIGEMKDFTPSYLSGFYADTSDVDQSVYTNELEIVAAKESYNRIAGLKPFWGLSLEGFNPSLTPRKLHSRVSDITPVMFPVWFLSYRKGDRVAYATVNGQTGKVVADLPVDITKYMIGSGILAILIFVLMNMFFTFRPSIALTITAVISLIVLILNCIESHKIRRRENYSDDKGLRAAMKVGNDPVNTKKINRGFWGSIITLITAVAVLVIDPVSDTYFYAAIIFCAIIIFFNLTDLIEKYNILATRRLPQFDHKGGDDNA